MQSHRKRIIYMDFGAIERGSYLSGLEQATHERLMTARDWDSLIFWMDLEEALKELTENQRECFVSYYIKGYNTCEISKRLHVKQPVIWRYIYAARKKIKNFLSEGYKTP